MYGTQTMTTVNDAAPIRIAVRDRIMDIALNRPDKKNALSDEMYLALIAALRQAQTDGDVRVVLLRAEGDCFCAGNDLHAFRNRQPSASVRLTKRLLKASRLQAVQDTIATESRHFAERLGSTEFADAFAAFFHRESSVAPSP